MDKITTDSYPSDKDKENDNKKIIAAIYARVSSGQQVFGYSLDEQIRLARERCDLMGWKVRYIFRENGKSGSTTDRPKFQALLMQAKEKSFDVLVFWKLDRFCRSLLDVVNVEKKLKEYGVSLYSLSEQIDTTTSFGRFNFRNIASAAEWERDMIKERSRLGMKALALQHKWPNRIVPFGYDKGTDNCLKVNIEEAKIVKWIFKRYLRLKSMPQIAFELNKKNIKTKRGGHWCTVSVKNILDNKLYIGRYKVAGIEAFIKDLKILNQRTFNCAEKVRNKFKGKTNRMPKSRKEELVNRVFNEYLSFIQDEEQQIDI